MDISPAKFLFGFLIFSVILWILFIFAARLLAWFISRVIGAYVVFRVGGWRCLRDVVVKFEKGAVESVSIGEIRLSLRQSLVRLGVCFFSHDPKLQVLICDVEVTMRSSLNSRKKARSQKSRNSGRGMWMIVVNVAKFLSVSVADLVVVVKTPKIIIETRELKVDSIKDGSSVPTLFLQLDLAPITVHIGDPRVSCDHPSFLINGVSSSEADVPFAMMDRTSIPICCEALSLSCEFCHYREVGVVFKNFDIACGEITVNLNEEIFRKTKSTSNVFSHTAAVPDSNIDCGKTEKLPKNKIFSSVTKYISLFPEKVGFILPKLDVNFIYREHALYVENKITGIQLKTMKSNSIEDIMCESTRLDVEMDFSEIHILREAGISIFEILKVDVVSSAYIPMQASCVGNTSNTPIRAEIDVKLGGTRCNIMSGRLNPWIQLHYTKKEQLVLPDKSYIVKKPSLSDFKSIMWTCTVSAPEMAIVLYNISSSPLYHGCSQSAHLFANNISSSGTAVHVELGEINLHLADEYEECLKESLFGVETNLNSLVHIARFSLDCKDLGSSEDHGPKSELVLIADVTGMSIYFNIKRLESLITGAISLQAFLKNTAYGKKTQSIRRDHSSKTSKRVPILKFNLERCTVNLSGDSGLENTSVADPKHVNYGSQGGQVLVRTLADGTLRSAYIISTVCDELKKLKYSVSLEVFHLSLCTNKTEKSIKLEVEKARSIYHEYLQEQTPVLKIVLLDIQNAKFVQRFGCLKKVIVCSYFSASNITVRWEPDVHLSLFELVLRLKLLVHKLHEIDKKQMVDASCLGINENQSVDAAACGQYDKPHKKLESVFAIDVEILTISAGVGDGVDVTSHVQSIFSENARIGLLLEGIVLTFNDSRVFKSSRMQVSRIPSSNSLVIPTTWDWIIQGIDVHICMPFRLQLRAIEDSVEDMLRCLRLVIAAKTELINPVKKEIINPKKLSSRKLGSIKLSIRKLTADIEEEPIQGWLDEHYYLMKNEACEIAVRLKYLEDLILKGEFCSESSEINDSNNVRKFFCNGIEVDLQDSFAVCQLKEEMYKHSFRSYFEACKKLNPGEGSGACRQGFQAGFRSSTTRTSLLSISATELEVNLTKIDGGNSGMIEVLKKLDPVCEENNIPFSRLLGRDILVHAGSLVANLRDYTSPLFSATSGKCEGYVVLAQQATCFQPQIHQDVFIGRYRKVRMYRSASGTTPPMKAYLNLPIHFQRAEISFGVGYEPAFADISYAFTVALRRANLSLRADCPIINDSDTSNSSQMSNSSIPVKELPKKERSLPWWDDVRYYIHGKIILFFSETKWNILATTDPYEQLDKLEAVCNCMEIKQSDGQICFTAKDFKILLSSLESLVKNCSLKLPDSVSCPFLEAPTFSIEINMDWECDSGNPLNHYLHALPFEAGWREKVYDPFRSSSLSLRWSFLLRPSSLPCQKQFSSSTMDNSTILDEAAYKPEDVIDSPTMHVGAHDLAWIFKFWNLNYIPPHKLRSFSRWPRFGIPRGVRSGNMSLDKVMTEFMLRIDASPTCINHVPLHDDDPAKGLVFKIMQLKYELCYSRGNQKYTFECKREPLDLVYQGLDLYLPNAYLNRENCTSVANIVKMTGKGSRSGQVDQVVNGNINLMGSCSEKIGDDGFLLSSDYFTIKRQAPKADSARLLAWQEDGRRNLEMTYVRSDIENESESDEHARSDPSDDGYNVELSGLKLLWTIENRDAVWSWVGGISKAFEPPKPSPSRQYAHRKTLEKTQVPCETGTIDDDMSKIPSGFHNQKYPLHSEQSFSSAPDLIKMDNSSSVAIGNQSEKNAQIIDSEGGTRHFEVNVVGPQFNLHSEEANGRFLLAAVSGRVLARSFHSVLHVGAEMIEKLGTGDLHIPKYEPEMTSKRMEFSVMLERVQAHVAPTDVDPGAGLQWLPKIRRSSPKLKRTGALLERVFMPCDMYFRYTRYKGGTTDLKVKPLKELTFNSHDITATMTSRQFQVMQDVLSNLLFARLPKPRKSSLSYPAEDDDGDVEEEADEMVPYGIEEVELARVNLEQKERELKLLLDDIRRLSFVCNASSYSYLDVEGDLWMMAGGRLTLVQRLNKEFVDVKKCRKMTSASLRMALQKAAQLRLMEKDKNKSPSYAMRISLQIKKVVWGMLVDGNHFAEAEINDMIYDFERDYRDVGVARFTTKNFVVRNCLPNAKSDMLLSVWNAPSDWGKKVMLKVDAKQRAPKDGSSPLELFHVEIYPLKIHLTETMYKMMWEYFFPEKDQDSHRRQETWKVSTTAGLKRVKKSSTIHSASVSSSHLSKGSEIPYKSSGSIVPITTTTGMNQFPVNAESSQASKLQNLKTNFVCGSVPELRRTSSFDRTWEENLAESVADELVLQVQSSGASSSRTGPTASADQPEEHFKNKLKESKPTKTGRTSHEEKKVGRSSDEKRPRPRKMMEFHNIKISQVELLVTYEGSRFSVSDMRLLMDTFHLVEFTGTWRRLFSGVKKHIIWGVLKSVTGMQGKKFKDKAPSQREHSGMSIPNSDLHFSDSDGGEVGTSDRYPVSWLRKPSDGAGDGFVTSIRGLFNFQRRKARAFVLRTMRGEAENEYQGDWSESDAEFSPVARQLTISKAKKLIRRHTKKYRSKGHKGSSQRKESLPSSSIETTAFEMNTSDGSSSPTYEDFND